MAGFFSRLFGRKAETKAAVATPVNGAVSPGPMFAAFMSPVEIQPWQAWQMFVSSSTFSKIVHLVAYEVARLVPQVKINVEFVSDTPIHAILKHPGRGRD